PEPAKVEPGPAAHDVARPAAGSLRVLTGRLVGGAVPVAAPLPDVAVHVIQAPGVGLVGADAGRPPQVRPPGGAAVGVVAVEVGLGGAEGGAAVKRLGRRGPAPAGVFPLRL